MKWAILQKSEPKSIEEHICQINEVQRGRLNYFLEQVSKENSRNRTDGYEIGYAIASGITGEIGAKWKSRTPIKNNKNVS